MYSKTIAKTIHLLYDHEIRSVITSNVKHVKYEQGYIVFDEGKISLIELYQVAHNELKFWLPGIIFEYQQSVIVDLQKSVNSLKTSTMYLSII